MSQGQPGWPSALVSDREVVRGENGRRLVVRNGSHQPREVLTSAGAVEVTVPRVNDKRTDPVTGERERSSSAILPPWCRKTPTPLALRERASSRRPGPRRSDLHQREAGRTARR